MIINFITLLLFSHLQIFFRADVGIRAYGYLHQCRLTTGCLLINHFDFLIFWIFEIFNFPSNVAQTSRGTKKSLKNFLRLNYDLPCFSHEIAVCFSYKSRTCFYYYIKVPPSLKLSPRRLPASLFSQKIMYKLAIQVKDMNCPK